MSLFPLRPLQQRALDKLKDSLRGGLHRRPIIQGPTGFGKTVIAAHVAQGALDKGKRTAFVVPMITLVDQTLKRFEANGIEWGDMGVMQGDHPHHHPAAPIQICSVQTIASRGWPEVDSVMVDECHLRFKVIEEWIRAQANKIFIGFSATPWARGLAEFWDDLIIPASISELIGEGLLSPFRVFAPSHPDLTGVKIQAGDYHEGQLSERMSKAAIVADVVQTWLAKAERRPTLLFAVDRAHAAILHEQFEAAGVTSAYVDANTPREERAQIGRQLESGRLEVICSVGTMTHGVDLDVRCIVLARPTRSEILFVQMIGRGLRTAPGKNDCIARDSLVLTDKGEIKIQDVMLDHKVWDGIKFVDHAGAICKGVQPIMSHDGITATPDHMVMTDDGWKTIQEAHRKCLRIARTGFIGKPIRLVDDRNPPNGDDIVRPESGGRVRASYGMLPQFKETTRDGGMSSLQRTQASDSSAMAISSMSGSAIQMFKSIRRRIRSLWKAWNRVQISWTERRNSRQIGAWKLKLGDVGREHEQHTSVRSARKVHSFQNNASRCQICGQHIDALDSHEDDGSRNQGSVDNAVLQTKGEVWDILNAGFLQRFTANGRLVHNCLILDHSDSHLNLGMVTDICHDELRSGTNKRGEEPERKPPLPRDCPQCAYLIAPYLAECPNCGFRSKQACNVHCAEGELIEFEVARKLKRKANREMSWEEKALFYGQLQSYGLEQDYKPGWAANKYKEKFGVWPNDPRVKYASVRLCGQATRSWVRASQIRFAKGRERVNVDTISVHPANG